MANVSPIIQELKFKKKFPGLNEAIRYRRFNNCLMHYKGPYYLMTYRLFYPNASDARYKKDSRKYHPWSSFWGSELDTTIIAVLKWTDKKQFKIIREMKIQWPDRYATFEHNLQDARILRLGNKIYVYGQAWIDQDDAFTDTVLSYAAEKANVPKCIKRDE